MKYIWIVMLIVVEIVWFIFSLKDFIATVTFVKTRHNVFDSLEGYTYGFIIVHLCLLFGYSLALFIKGLG